MPSVKLRIRRYNPEVPWQSGFTSCGPRRSAWGCLSLRS